jgi:haloacetate dehalogenase
VADLLDGFEDCPADLDGVRINARRAGAGPPLLLLHGYPQSMVMWHRIAPSLAADYTVVVADLRGYGGSSKPAGGPGHRNYTKRVLALDMVTLMTRLGHDRFVVAGHDRGGRVAHRMALDAPDRIAALAVLDIVPTRHMFTHVDRAMATTYFHWFFLTAREDLPEKLINGNPEAWIDSRFAGAARRGSADRGRRAGRVPARIHRSARCARDLRGLPGGGRAGP